MVFSSKNFIMSIPLALVMLTRVTGILGEVEETPDFSNKVQAAGKNCSELLTCQDCLSNTTSCAWLNFKTTEQWSCSSFDDVTPENTNAAYFSPDNCQDSPATTVSPTTGPVPSTTATTAADTTTPKTVTTTPETVTTTSAGGNSTKTTTPVPSSTTAKPVPHSGGFDTGAFFGGITLSGIIVATGYLGYRFCKNRTYRNFQ